MRLSGQGITGYKTLNVKPDFTPSIDRAIRWAQASNGNWVATDRGAASDIYQSNIRIYSRENEINDILTAIYDNRVVAHADASKLYLDWIDPDEDQKIFGPDIDYTNGVYVTVTDVGDRKQMSFHAWQLMLTLRIWDTSALSFIGTAGNVAFDSIDVGYVGDQVYTDKRVELFEGSPILIDKRYDSGLIEFTATLTKAQMITFRRSLSTQRVAPITTTSLSGVNYTFGPNKVVTFPCNLRYIKVNELGMWGQHYYRVQCQCAEVI